MVFILSTACAVYLEYGINANEYPEKHIVYKKTKSF